MRTSFIALSVAFVVILTSCQSTTGPTGGISGAWAGQIDGIPMQLSLRDYADSLKGTISWHRQDTLFLYSISSLSIARSDSVFIIVEPVFMFITPAYLRGKISGNSLDGTYFAFESTRLSPSGAWNATRVH